jgi:hypothetical protein
MRDTPARPDAGTTLETVYRMVRGALAAMEGRDVTRHNGSFTPAAEGTARITAKDILAALTAERERLVEEVARLTIERRAADALGRAALFMVDRGLLDARSAVGASAGEEPDTATDYYHTEMQRLSGEGEPSDG